jgi:hypothetical protein
LNLCLPSFVVHERPWRSQFVLDVRQRSLKISAVLRASLYELMYANLQGDFS